MFCMRCVCTEVLLQTLSQTLIGALRKRKKERKKKSQMKSVCNLLTFLFCSVLFCSERPREMQHHQVSRCVLREPGSRASAVLSEMHRSDLPPDTNPREKMEDVCRLSNFCSSGAQVRIPAGLRASVKSCRYNGTVYQPGETFNKRDLFPSKQSNQCVMCMCSVSPLLLFYTFHFFLRQNGLCQRKCSVMIGTLKLPDVFMIFSWQYFIYIFHYCM